MLIRKEVHTVTMGSSIEYFGNLQASLPCDSALALLGIRYKGNKRKPAHQRDTGTLMFTAELFIGVKPELV